MFFRNQNKLDRRFVRRAVAVSLFLYLLALSSVNASAQSSLPPLLAVTPSTLAILVGESAPLSVINQTGNPLADAEWSVSSSIAEIIHEDNRTELLAKEPGRLVVTASTGSHSATASVTILAVLNHTEATVQWSVLPIPGFQTLIALPAMPAQGSDVGYYSIEGNGADNALVRAFNDSGQQLWMRRLSSTATPLTFQHVLPPSGDLYLNQQVVNDHAYFIIGAKSAFAGVNPTDLNKLGLPPDGQAILLHLEGDFSGGVQLLERGRFRDSLLSIAPDGHEAWRYKSQGRLSQSWTSNSSNSVGIVETLSNPPSAALLILNANTGQVSFKIDFPQSSSTINGFRCTDARRNVFTSLRPSNAGSVFTSTDDDIYVQVETHVESQNLEKCKDTQWSFDDKIALLRVATDGQAEWNTFQHIHADGEGQFHVQTRLAAGETIPDGFGGVLAAWTTLYPDVTKDRPFHSEAHISRIDSHNQRDFTLPLVFWTSGITSYFADCMVLGEGNALYATNGPLLIRFDIQAGDLSWQRHPPTGSVKLQHATAGGGVLVANAGELVYFDAAGNGMPLRWTVTIPNTQDIGLVQSEPDDHTPLPPIPLRSLNLDWRNAFIAVEDGPPLGHGSLISLSAPQ